MSIIATPRHSLLQELWTNTERNIYKLRISSLISIYSQKYHLNYCSSLINAIRQCQKFVLGRFYFCLSVDNCPSSSPLPLRSTPVPPVPGRLPRASSHRAATCCGWLHRTPRHSLFQELWTNTEKYIYILRITSLISIYSEKYNLNYCSSLINVIRQCQKLVFWGFYFCLSVGNCPPSSPLPPRSTPVPPTPGWPARRPPVTAAYVGGEYLMRLDLFKILFFSLKHDALRHLWAELLEILTVKRWTILLSKGISFRKINGWVCLLQGLLDD